MFIKNTFDAFNYIVVSLNIYSLFHNFIDNFL